MEPTVSQKTDIIENFLMGGDNFLMEGNSKKEKNFSVDIKNNLKIFSKDEAPPTYSRVIETILEI